MQSSMTPDASMCSIQFAPDQTILDTDIDMSSNDESNSSATDSNDALTRAKSDALETAEAMEDLVHGIQAVKRILERPVDEMELSNTDDDVTLVSSLSQKLVGVLGSELMGLLNSAQMAKSHAKLCIDDNSSIEKELHSAREETQSATDRADRMGRSARRLKKEKKLLVQKVQALQEDRRVLIREVKFLRKKARLNKDLQASQFLQNAMKVHQSVLKEKAFTSRFSASDPPGTVTPKATDVEFKKIMYVPFGQTNDEMDIVPSISNNKEIEGKDAYLPRKEACSNVIHGILIYDKDANKPFATSSATSSATTSTPIPVTPTEPMPAPIVTPAKQVDTPPVVAKSTPPPDPVSNPIRSTTPSKSRGLSFSQGFGSSLSRFKNAILHPEIHPQNPSVQKKEELPTKNEDDHNPATNINVSILSSTSDNDCKIVDDEATKSTKSCSFETSGINTSMNLDSILIRCGDNEEMENDLAFQISIEEGSSFLDTSRISHNQHTEDNSNNDTSHFVITPESSPVAGRTNSDEVSKPLFNPSVLVRLGIPDENRGEPTASFPALKARPGAFPLVQ